MSYLEVQLVQAKVQWAQAEEDKDLAEFKAKELKKALAKGREINMQFAKRMTKLEVFTCVRPLGILSAPYC